MVRRGTGLCEGVERGGEEWLTKIVVESNGVMAGVEREKEK
jgi:hypothetical protein